MNSLVFSNMLHRPARTAVSIFGIAVGILLIIFTIGLAEGSLRKRAQQEANVGAEIMLRPSGTMGLSGADALRLPASLSREIAKVDGVKSAVPIAQNTASASDTNTGSRLVDGVNFDEYSAISGMRIIEGRAFTDGADEIISDTAWLTPKNLKIGDSLKIYDRNFTIVGTYEPAAGARIKIPLSTLQTQLGSEGKASAILVKVSEGFTLEAVAEKLLAAFPEHQIILTKDLEELYMSSIPALDVFLNVVIGVAGGVSALIILLTMYTTVTERTRQIGILKALGMSKLGIAWIILQEAVLLSLSGIILGVILTFALKYALANWSSLTVDIDRDVVLLVLIVGALSGVVGALYPALRAARLDAVEALSYE